MRFHKEFDRKGLKRENARVEGNAQGDNIPIAHAELEQIGENHLVGRDFSQSIRLLGVHFHHPVSHRAKYA